MNIPEWEIRILVSVPLPTDRVKGDFNTDPARYQLL